MWRVLNKVLAVSDGAVLVLVLVPNPSDVSAGSTAGFGTRCLKKNELRSRDSRVASQTNKRSDLKALTYEADNAKQWGLGVVHRDL